MTSSSSTNASSEDLVAAVGEASATSERRGRRTRRSTTARWAADAGVWVATATIVAAPLAVGCVHRSSLFAAMAAALVSLLMLWWGSLSSGRPLRIGLATLVPLPFVCMALFQSIPLPFALRSLFDGKGSSLLVDGSFAPISTFPLSLDPPVTRGEIGKAAVAAAVFLVAIHVASGQRRRQLLIRGIATTGIAAVVIGIGHRILGTAKIYGAFGSTHRTLLIGPFVNANHTAELLELCAFVCLACSFLRPTALNRIGWLTGMALCLGGVAATLSRGGVAAVAMGVLTFAVFRYLTRDEGVRDRRRAALAWGGLLLGLVVLGAGALGAGQLVDRFHAGNAGSDLRFQVWKDSLKVIAAHPFGIGRGAFDRVFPIYRTVRTDLPLRFAFVENEPLQLLVDGGWFFFSMIGLSLAFLVWQLLRRGRRDKIEAALLAGLAAVMLHNLVDFGLETLGILLPFMAVLGTVVGRTFGPQTTPLSRWPRLATVGIIAACLLVGMVSIAHATNDNFDNLLKRPESVDARRDLLLRAQRAHPIDYYYVLQFSRLEPLKGPPGAPSPRLHALNRALLLCPTCEPVHLEIARNLWQLRLRRQALLEWRLAVSEQPGLLSGVLGELFRGGASPIELASVAASDPDLMIQVAEFLTAASRPRDALKVLDQASALRGNAAEILVARAQLELQLDQPDQAASTLREAHGLGLRDPRLAVLDAQLMIAVRGTAAADEALGVLDRAAAQNPFDRPVQRARLDLVMKYEKWQAADRALEGLKQALYRAQGHAGEAHLAAARIGMRLSRFVAALGEYRLALADASGDVTLWIEYSQAARRAGRPATAREALAAAARLSPNSSDVARAQQALDEDQANRVRLDEGRSALAPY